MDNLRLKEAFIHYLDLGLYFNAFDEFVRKTNTNTNANDLFTGIKLGPILAKEGQIENHLKPGGALTRNTLAYLRLFAEMDFMFSNFYIFVTYSYFLRIT